MDSSLDLDWLMPIGVAVRALRESGGSFAQIRLTGVDDDGNTQVRICVAIAIDDAAPVLATFVDSIKDGDAE